MTNSHKTAERIASIYLSDTPIIVDVGSLTLAIERALTQAHEEGRKETIEECAKVAEDKRHWGCTWGCSKEIAQRLRGLK